MACKVRQMKAELGRQLLYRTYPSTIYLPLPSPTTVYTLAGYLYSAINKYLHTAYSTSSRRPTDQPAPPANQDTRAHCDCRIQSINLSTTCLRSTAPSPASSCPYSSASRSHQTLHSSSLWCVQEGTHARTHGLCSYLRDPLPLRSATSFECMSIGCLRS